MEKIGLIGIITCGKELHPHYLDSAKVLGKYLANSPIEGIALMEKNGDELTRIISTAFFEAKGETIFYLPENIFLEICSAYLCMGNYSAATSFFVSCKAMKLLGIFEASCDSAQHIISSFKDFPVFSDTNPKNLIAQMLEKVKSM